MNRFLQIVLGFGLLIGIVGSVRALDFMYISDNEMTVFGDRIKFWHGDTLCGRVHSNSQIAIGACPMFCALVTTTADDFAGQWWEWDGCFTIPPVFNAPYVPIPERAEELRSGAAAEGHFYAGDGYYYQINFIGSMAKMFRWTRGIPVDSSDYWYVPLDDSTCIFVDAPLRVKGLVQGNVTVGSSKVLEIEDDIRYVDASIANGSTPITSTNYLALVSEGHIKIRNTVANGRENSNGLGNNQSNRDYTSVVITAAIYALGGSFTFENQNDPDSGYVSDSVPDDRGTIYLYGAICQRQRGYMHRSSNSSTGYLKQYRYDRRFLQHDMACMFDYFTPNPLTTDTVNFGDVVVGTTVWDTAMVYTNFNHVLGAVWANYPFAGVRPFGAQGKVFAIPARFTPPRAGPFSGYLYVSAGYENFTIVLQGNGVAEGEPLQLALDISPNPFNLSTTLRYLLPEPGEVMITLYDILGRAAYDVHLTQQSAGVHTYHLNAANLASGVYFVRMQTPTQAVSRKLLLIK